MKKDFGSLQQKVDVLGTFVISLTLQRHDLNVAYSLQREAALTFPTHPHSLVVHWVRARQ